MSLGWNKQQIQNALESYVRVTGSGQYGGTAGQFEDRIRKTAFRNGVSMSDKTIGTYVRKVISGNMDIGTAEDYIRKSAMSAFPALMDQIKGGMDVADIASPYMQAMGSILELNPERISLFDPTIRKALASTNKDGKPTVKPIWQFESELKKDTRWL